MGRFNRWAPYVSVAQRRKNAEKEAQRLAKNGTQLNPLRITGRNIATTFWGKAWCDNLEDYCDEYNRMPRGRTYARNGSVVDLQVNQGKITGLVSGSSLYKISIVIDSLSAIAWQKLCQACSQEVVSLLDLMRGRLSDTVIMRLTDPKDGLFPKPKEIKVACSCPDDARMCKHIAAVLYGVGHRLDSSPELFFQLRGVDQAELVSQALAVQNSSDVMGLDQSSDFATEDLGAMFGIDLAVTTPNVDSPDTTRTKARRVTKSNNSESNSSTTVVTKRSTKKAIAKPAASTAKQETGKKVASRETTIPTMATSQRATSQKATSKATSEIAPAVAASRKTKVTRPIEKDAESKIAKRESTVRPAQKKSSSR